MKYLDMLWSSLDVRSGLFWAMQRAGAVERLVSDDQIARAMIEPPHETRAYVRATLLRRAAPAEVRDIDCDEIRFNVTTPSGGAATRTLQLPDPLFNRAQFESLTDANASLDELLDQLGADAAIPRHAWTYAGQSRDWRFYGYPQQE